MRKHESISDTVAVGGVALAAVAVVLLVRS
jgi:hypothetical protein